MTRFIEDFLREIELLSRFSEYNSKKDDGKLTPFAFSFEVAFS